MRSLHFTALWVLLFGGVIAAPIDSKDPTGISNRGYGDWDDDDDCCGPPPHHHKPHPPPPPPPPPPCWDDPCDDYDDEDDDCDDDCDGDIHHHHIYPHPPPPPPPPPPRPPFPFPFPFPMPFPQQPPTTPPTMPNMPAVCAPNPITNGNFNNAALTPWVASNTAAITVVQSPPNAPGFGNAAGGFAVQFAIAQATGTGLTLTQANVAVCALHRYTLSFQVASDTTATTGGCTMTVSFNGVTVSTVPLAVPNTGATAQTASFVTTNTTPTIGSLVFTLACTNAAGAGTGNIYLDNVVLTV